MFDVDKNGNIKVNKGDTFNVPLFIDIGENLFISTRFVLKEGDEVTFRLFEANAPECCSLIKKTLTKIDANDYGDILIGFDHGDTDNLFPGIYFYEIILKRPQEPKDAYITIVPRRKFVIQ